MQNSIKRYGTTQRWSDATAFQNIAFFCEVPDNPTESMREQSTRVLALLESSLLKANASKQTMLSCTIYITNRADVALFNEVWDQWVPTGCAPVRACVIADLVDPALKVEIQMTAATNL